MINWTNDKCQVTSHFTVKDALFLHAWKRLADIEKDKVNTDRIIALCHKLELVREILKCPMTVTSFFRSREYNRSQKISPENDVHAMSIAADFTTEPHLTIIQAKRLLRPCLEELKLRMEYGTTSWIHLDMRHVGPSGREFRP